MPYFDDTVPSDNEPVRLGASRIRELNTALETLLIGTGKPFTDLGAPQTNWVTTTQINNAAVTSAKIAAGAITTSLLADAVLSADSTGRAKMADGFITQAKLDPGFVVLNGSVNTTQLADNAVTTSKIAAGAITAAKFAAGASTQTAIGTYSMPTPTASGLVFTPDFVVIIRNDINGIWTGFLAEAPGVGTTSILHAGDNNNSVGSANTIQWNVDGFTIVNTGGLLTVTGKQYYYLALKIV